jgi:hypothetical protein
MGILSFLFGSTQSREQPRAFGDIVFSVRDNVNLQSMYITVDHWKAERWKMEPTGWLFGYLFGMTEGMIEMHHPMLPSDNKSALLTFPAVYGYVLGKQHGTVAFNFSVKHQFGHEDFSDGRATGVLDGIRLFKKETPMALAIFFNGINKGRA